MAPRLIQATRLFIILVPNFCVQLVEKKSFLVIYLDQKVHVWKEIFFSQFPEIKEGGGGSEDCRCGKGNWPFSSIIDSNFAF